MSVRAAIRSLLLLAISVASAIAQQDDATLARYSDEARKALASKHWPEAVKALQRLAQLAPDVPQVRAQLGLALFFEGRSADALQAFEDARKLDPALPQVQTMIGLCDAELGRHHEAVAILTPAFDQPPDPDTGRLIGLHLERSYAELRQFDKALATGEELLKRYPNNPEILYQVSRLHADRSYRLMKQLVEAAPDSYWVHMANAQVQESAQRYDLAAREYRKAIELNPSAPGVHVALGRAILSGSKDPQAIAEASREFERELALSPENPTAEFELGEIARERGESKAAAEHFSNAIRYNADFYEAHLGLGRVLLKEGNARDAIVHFEAAARIAPHETTPHYLLASAYKKLGDSDRASRELDAYSKLHANISASTLKQSADGHR